MNELAKYQQQAWSVWCSWQQEIISLRKQNSELVQTIVSGSLLRKCIFLSLITVIQNKNPYAVVLVDGDNAKFRDDLLQSSYGGIEAAVRLESAIKSNLAYTTLREQNLPILVRVFANVKEPPTSFRSADVTPSETGIQRFAEQFTNSKPEYDFVDVSHEKNGTGTKILSASTHVIL